MLILGSRRPRAHTHLVAPALSLPGVPEAVAGPQRPPSTWAVAPCRVGGVWEASVCLLSLVGTFLVRLLSGSLGLEPCVGSQTPREQGDQKPHPP